MKLLSRPRPRTRAGVTLQQPIKQDLRDGEEGGLSKPQAAGESPGPNAPKVSSPGSYGQGKPGPGLALGDKKGRSG